MTHEGRRTKPLWYVFVAQAKFMVDIHQDTTSIAADLRSYFTEEERLELGPMIRGAYADKPGTKWPSFYASFGSPYYNKYARVLSQIKDYLFALFPLPPKPIKHDTTIYNLTQRATAGIP